MSELKFPTAKILSSCKLKHRPEQEEFARLVYQALEKNENVRGVMARTGVGKTIAYLLAGTQYIDEHPGSRILIATPTRTLQEQMMSSDFPLVDKLARAMGLKPVLRADICGAANYACRLAVEGAYGHMQVVNDWLDSTDKGRLADLAAILKSSPEDLEDLRADPTCEMDCEDCYFLADRDNARTAEITVLNHTLLLLNWRFNPTTPIFGDFAAVICDEVHRLQNIATATFGAMVSQFAVRRLLRTAGRLPGIDHKGLEDYEAKIREACLRLADMAPGSASLAIRIGNDELKGYHQRTYKQGTAQVARLITAAAELLRDGNGGRKKKEGLRGTFIRRRLIGMANLFTRFCDGPTQKEESKMRGNYVHRLVVRRSRKDPKNVWISLIESPISVKGLIKAHVWSRAQAAVVVSGTLSDRVMRNIGGQRLGANLPIHRLANSVSTPLIGHVPRENAPAPSHDKGTDRTYWLRYLKHVILLAAKEPGGVAAFFASWTDLQDAAALFTRDQIPPERELVVHSHNQCMEETSRRFRKTCGRGILLALFPLATGSDFPEDLLSNVVITRIPFASFAEPSVKSQVARLKRERNLTQRQAESAYFGGTMVADAIDDLIQTVGRIPRGPDDSGHWWMADHRIIEDNHYGKRMLTAITERFPLQGGELLEIPNLRGPRPTI